MKHGISSWLPTFQKLEKELTDKYKLAKKACGDLTTAVSRYGGEETKQIHEAKQLMDLVLVTCSEGLLLRALGMESAEQRRHDVRLHMQRMADQKVGAVSDVLLAACQKILS